ncbi:MAG: glutamine--fructose-6-phosphate transaminase (isomerizing) [Pseudomonadota bacterium]
MCGIVGVLGQLEAAPRILDALKRLEYRGYDSAGLTTLENGVPVRRRAVGKLKELIRLVAANPAHGSVGIGHTRWATHGAPNVTNAHPHAAGPVHVVHNGIIENFRELRASLQARGVECQTDTDTEVVAQMVAAGMADGMSPLDAVNHTLNQVTGAFALVFLFSGETDLMIAARHGSPLAIGWGEEEMFVGSDAMALSPMTSQITYLEEGDRAMITRAGAEIFDASGERVTRVARSVSVDSVLADKGSHRHFMAKEIHEQPKTLGYVLSHYISADKETVVSHADEVDWHSVSRIILVACGTASYAGHVAKYWFEQLTGIPVEFDIASEFRYRNPPLSGDEVAIVVSQSGETADTLAALRYMKGRVRTTIAIVNVIESSMAREVDIILPTLAGPEIGVASTKAFTSQLGTLACTAIIAARMRGAIDADEERRLISKLLELPRAIMEVLSHENAAAQTAQDIAMARDILFLGRGNMFPIALEGALKLKEISYIHAAGHAGGELKHGPIALVDEQVPVVVIAPHDSLFEKTVSNMQEVIARSGKVVMITDQAGAAEAGDEVWRLMVMPDIDPFAAPILYSVPAQLIAYYAALAKGTDVDQPRNLAKSVTVE